MAVTRRYARLKAMRLQSQPSEQRRETTIPRFSGKDVDCSSALRVSAVIGPTGMNIDVLSKWLNAGASIQVIIGVVTAIAGVIVRKFRGYRISGAAVVDTVVRAIEMSERLGTALEGGRGRLVRDLGRCGGAAWRRRRGRNSHL